MNCNDCLIKQVASEKSLDVYTDLLPCSDCGEWGKHHAELLFGKRLGKVERSILLQLAEKGKVCSTDFVKDDSRSDRVKVLRAISALYEYRLVLIASEMVEVPRKTNRYWWQRSKVNKRLRTCESSRIGTSVMAWQNQSTSRSRRIYHVFG